MTPYEAWYGYKPKVQHFRVLGCDAYAHIPRDERGKFDLKSRKCILIGYGQKIKGYRLFDPSRRKVIHTRDVKFNENEKKSEEVPISDQNHHWIVDFSDPQPQACRKSDSRGKCTRARS